MLRSFFTVCLSLAATALSAAVTIGGDQMQWHRVDLTLDAISASQTDTNPNPFMDYRFNVTFTSPSGDTFVVPGYFAGDGAGGSSGDKWVAHLNPSETGTWTYTTSFRSGNNVAVSTGSTPGSKVSAYDGLSGSFSVSASNKSGDDFRAPDKGMLINRGQHYLTYGGSGKPFVYTGPGIPENILGYRGFTNTTIGIGHEFDAHLSDWNSGDPNWPKGSAAMDGKRLIGAFNFIAEQGGNAIYMMSNTIGGDGEDCFPHPTSTGAKQSYDLLKLHQWDIALAYAQSLGIFLHWHLAEHESANMNYYGSSAIPNDRKLLFRMLNARFGHYNGLKWNIMEECEWNASERADQMAYLKAVDPYNHPVTWQAGGAGLPRGHATQNYGDPNMDAGSFQGSPSRTSIFNEIVGYREGSAAAGVPWTVAWDEPQRIDNTTDSSQSSNNLHVARYDKMWPTMMAGGDGFMWYIRLPGGSHGYDQRIEDFDDNGMSVAWNWCGYVRDFLEPLPLLEMQPSLNIVDSGTGNDYALYKAGEVYAIFNDRAGKNMTLDLSGVSSSATFDVRWFDPRNGGSLQTGTVATVTGGGSRALGNAPSNTGQDWAVLVQLAGGPPPPNEAPTVAFLTPTAGQDFAEPANVSVEVDASDSDGTIASVDLYLNGGFVATENQAPYEWSFTGLTADNYLLRVVAFDDDGASAETTIPFSVTGVPVGQGTYNNGGQPWALTASGTSRIEAEDYDVGGAGVAYSDTSAGNSGGAYRAEDVDIQSTGDVGGGFNIGWTATDEWLEYTVDVAAAGTYLVEVRGSRRGNGTRNVVIEAASSAATVTIVSTGAWQTYTTASAELSLDAGVQVIRMRLAGGGVNLNWLQFTATSTPPPTNLIDATFDTDAEGFEYVDDAFRGTNQPDYASGQYQAAGGFAGGGLSVTVGGINGADITDGMSGAWERDFSLDAATDLTLTLRYDLNANSKYDAGEIVEVLAAIDGTLVAPSGTVITSVEGGGVEPWTEVTIDLGTVAAGVHTLSIGAYNNQKTTKSEVATVRFDDVRIEGGSTPPPPPPPGEVTVALNPTHDAYRQGSQYYNDSHLKVEAGNRVSFLQYDLSSLAGVATAVDVVLAVGADAGSGTLRVYRGDQATWTEGALDAGSEPMKEVEIGTTSGSYGTGSSATITLDPDEFLLGTSVSLIVEMDSGGNDVWFSSSETASAPVLNVTYLPASGG